MMVEVTQEDREAAATLIKDKPLVDNPDMIIHKGADDGGFVQAFTKHRIQSTADLQAKLDKTVKALEPFADCMKYIGDIYEDDEYPDDWSPFVQVKHYKNAEAAIKESKA